MPLHVKRAAMARTFKPPGALIVSEGTAQMAATGGEGGQAPLPFNEKDAILKDDGSRLLIWMKQDSLLSGFIQLE